MFFCSLKDTKSPSKVSDKSVSMSDKYTSKRHADSGYGSYASDNNSSTKSSLSTLDRLRNNLSPVSTYCKPIMKTFGKRDDSPHKVSILMLQSHLV